MDLHLLLSVRVHRVIAFTPFRFRLTAFSRCAGIDCQSAVASPEDTAYSRSMFLFSRYCCKRTLRGEVSRSHGSKAHFGREIVPVCPGGIRAVRSDGKMQPSGKGERCLRAGTVAGGSNRVRQRELAEPPGLFEARWRGACGGGAARGFWPAAEAADPNEVVFSYMGHFPGRAHKEVQRAAQGWVPGHRPRDAQ